MGIIMFCASILIFALLQLFIFNKTKNKFFKFLLLGLVLVTLIACLLIYLNVAGIESSSVIAENQVFAKFLSTLCIGALVGCISAISLDKFKKK